MERLPAPARYYSIVVLTALAATPLTGSATQGPASWLTPGARVRATVSDIEPERRSGRVLALRPDTLVLRVGAETTHYPLTRVTRLEVSRKSGVGMAVGAAVGAGVGLAVGVAIPNAVDVPDEDKLGYAVLSTLSGSLIGAALGTGKRARVSGGIGFLLGTAIGAVTIGQACERDSPDYCALVYGAGYGGSIGLVIGSVIGALLPNWVPVQLDQLPLGLSVPAPGRYAATLTVKLPP